MYDIKIRYQKSVNHFVKQKDVSSNKSYNNHVHFVMGINVW